MDQDFRTPTAMLARVRAVHAGQRAAEVELVVLAAGWADAHPDLDPAPVRDPEEVDDPREVLDPLVPAMDWKAGAPFAAAIGVGTSAGEALVRDALTLRHRLPRVWARLVAGELPVWRARRIARAVYAQPADVADWLDETLAPLADRVGAITLDRLLDEAMLLLHPEQRELEQLEALDARHATLHEDSINHTGVAEMTLRGDWKDLSDFDATLCELAALLDDTESLDVRRMSLVVHLSADAVAGCHPVGRNETTGQAVLAQQIRDWCGRTDTHLTVTPVIDLREHVTLDRYEIGDRLKTRTSLRQPTCVFPWCTRPARSCDADHVIAHAAGGATCDCNLAPLCRRHHRLKTSAGWSYTTIETGVWLWSEPHGQQFLRTPAGTTDVTPPGRPVTTDNGCRAGPRTPTRC